MKYWSSLLTNTTKETLIVVLFCSINTTMVSVCPKKFPLGIVGDEVSVCPKKFPLGIVGDEAEIYKHVNGNWEGDGDDDDDDNDVAPAA
ncbi:hypothetical protein Nepgr_018997 [Nepenthes gracilis]|uniref:Uncharacterized protein n=1 Tax=Nepenthes gracilis TaxID=150966 RepID=A0AAD3SUJ0_NEPGR|nr:hypothetical protein Nepgr_018997 [Nepenthes gracilis]